jgi:hypothetical protein
MAGFGPYIAVYRPVRDGDGGFVSLRRDRDDRAEHIPRRVSHDGRLGAVYFEAAAVITALALLGQVLELRWRETSGGAMNQSGGLLMRAEKIGRDTGPKAMRSARMIEVPLLAAPSF